MEKLPLPTQTLYAEMLEQLLALEAHRSIGHLSGSFVSKAVKGGKYHYFQYSEPGGTLKQIYLGKEDPVLRKALRRFEEKRSQSRQEQENIKRLCAQLRAGGAFATDAASARVLRALADAGVFRFGGVLIGTHAFTVMGNLLGYRWKSRGLKTEDIDLASSPILSVAVPEMTTDIPKILDSLEIGFLPVPPLNPKKPSTSFKIRGQALRVDLLTSLTPQRHLGAVHIPRWNAAAQPLPYLDYLLEDFGQGAVVDGGGILVNVPAPARFALHKLITSQERGFAFHTKSSKDLRQAAQILRVLIEERRGDLEMAWETLKKRGSKWRKQAKKGLAALIQSEEEEVLPILETLRSLA